MTDGARSTTPWHLWVVGVVAALWNAMGAYDYVMSLLGGEAYYRESGMNSELVNYYLTMPGWVYAPWTLGIAGGVAGVILLLLRHRWAVPAYLASLFGATVSNASSLLLSDGAFLRGGMWIAPAIIFTGCLLQLWYAAVMRKTGVLR